MIVADAVRRSPACYTSASGSPPQHFQRSFEIFGRVHAESIYQGTGIGLAIVRKAAERLGGRVGVESRLERGARFWVELRAVAA